MATKTAPKAKTAVKAVAKKSVAKKPVAKKPVAKVHVKAPVKAKVPVAKPVVHAKSAVSKQAPMQRESMFARLLREKAERHEALQRQRDGGHHSNDQRMPQNHASYSKFAGPRRRAS